MARIFYAFSILSIIWMASWSTGCKEEVDPNEEVNNRLEGDWEVRSFQASSNGSAEFMGNVFQRVELEFEKTGPAAGEYTFTFVDVNGNTTVSRGDYELQNSGGELNLEPDNGSQDEEYDIEFDGDDMELDGFFDYGGGSTRAVIEAERS